MHGSAPTKSIFMTLCCALTASVVMPHIAHAQYPTLTSGTLTSAEVGDVEGIQRFGERLRTNPDPGIGYTYRVLPSVGARGNMDSQSMVWALAHIQEAYQLKQFYTQLANFQLARQKAQTEAEAQTLDAQIQATSTEIARLNLVLQLALGDSRSPQVSQYAQGFNPTAGLRSSAAPTLNGMSTASAPTGFAPSAAGVGPLSMSQNGTFSPSPVTNEIEIVHQPLIQIKVRIVEATRLNSAGFRSVLDYVSQNGPASLVGANNINGNNRSVRGRTRLPTTPGVLRESTNTAAVENGLLSKAAGSGALVNLSSQHINFITNMLVTDFSGDVLTVPEVVTLNGQNVEFVAGDNRPLPLGLTLVQSTGNVKQEVFYKHVGTLMSITPRIVNWGKYLEGAGEAPVVAQEVSNWNGLAAWMTDERNVLIPTAGANATEISNFKTRLAGYAKTAVPVPIEDKIMMLDQLEKYSAKTVRERLWQFDQSILRCPSGMACDWKPEDCTIDLEVMVRESQIQSDRATEGENAIANVVQVKSGNGVVMGGLIGAREIESVSKIPLLGDLPVVGYFFRSTAVDRAKTELIILIEATVLPSSETAREQTAQDFRLGHDYVSGSLRENPLEAGMYRAGFGQYLPQAGLHEQEYWTRHGNKMRKVATEVDDLFR